MRSYGEVLRLQQDLLAARQAGTIPDTLILVEHPDVITLGRSAAPANVLDAGEIPVFAVERGGDVTYHGPGQAVVYPIRKLERFREVVPLVSTLETAALAALARFGIAARTHAEHRGVYVGRNAICAVGLAVKRMTTLHGIALNVCTELDYDRLITPCGTPQFGITSIARELGRSVTWTEGRDVLLGALEETFGIRFVRSGAEPLAIGASAAPRMRAPQ